MVSLLMAASAVRTRISVLVVLAPTQKFDSVLLLTASAAALIREDNWEKLEKLRRDKRLHDHNYLLKQIVDGMGISSTTCPEAWIRLRNQVLFTFTCCASTRQHLCLLLRRIYALDRFGDHRYARFAQRDRLKHTSGYLHPDGHQIRSAHPR